MTSIAISLTLLLAVPGWAAPGHKRALLVAVHGYDRGRADDVLELETTPDVERMKAVLAGEPYRFDRITVLQTPQETTHQSIVRAFRRELIDATEPGDVVVFHYSGHGSEWPDPGDASYGVDQTLVPSDYVSAFDGSNDIKDKEIAALLRDLKERKPASVMLVFDSCHSGGMTRAPGAVRGFTRDTGAAPRAPLPSGLPAVADSGFVVFSACRPDEVDRETDDGQHHRMGALSYGMTRALATLQGADVTYRDLYDRVTCLMRERGLSQEPQVEGPTAQAVFGTRTLSRDPSVLVQVRANQVWLESGELHGTTVGSRVAIYSAGSKSGHSPIAVGEVIQVLPTRSLLKVSGAEPGALQSGLARFTERTFPAEPLTVDCSRLQAHPGLAAVLRGLAAEGLAVGPGQSGSDLTVWPLDDFLGPARTITPAGGGFCRLEVGRGQHALSLLGREPSAQALVLVRRDGTPVSFPVQGKYVQFLTSGDPLEPLLSNALRRESRTRLLMHLASSGNPQYRVRSRIIPCEVEGQRWRRDRPFGPLRLGEHFRLEIINENPENEPLYVSVLDLAGDGALGPLWPHPNFGSLISLVPAGPNWLPVYDRDVSGLSPEERVQHYAVYQVSEPTGQETLLTLATEKPVDFNSLLDPETLTPRAAKTPLETLFTQCATGSRAGSTTLPADAWSASSTQFTVLP